MKPSNRYPYALYCAIGILILCGILYHWDAHKLKQELSEYATSYIRDYLQLDRGERVVGMISTVTRRWLLFGEPSGKVDLYVALDTSQEPVKYVAYTFYYEKRNNQWTVVESGACSGTECQLAAQKLDKFKH